MRASLALAWLGLAASVLVLAILPVRLAGFFGHVSLFDTVNRLMWLPMLVFEVVLAFRLITKGAPAPAKADLR